MAKVKKNGSITRGYGDNGSTQRTDYGDHPKPYPFPSNQPSFHTDYDDYNSILGKLGVTEDSEFAQFLASLGINGTGSFNLSQSEDWNKQLLDVLLQYKSELEKRQYNEGLRDEQRLYDSPQAILARLMGAGLSRDAALQMLGSGAAGGSGSGIPYTEGISPDLGIAASQSTLNGAQANLANTQAGLGIVNSVFAGLNCVSGLVNIGFSIPQAIHQARILQAQSFMSKKSMQGLQSADSVLSALQNAVTSGAIGTKDFDGFSNATDALNYIFDHQNTKAFSGIINDGSFANVYGTKFGREMFASAWNNVRNSKDAGTQLDLFIKHSALQNSLANLDIQKSYIDIQSAMKDLEMKDPIIAQKWQDLYRSMVNTKTDEYNRDIARGAAYSAGINERANRLIFEDKENGGIGTAEHSGIQLLAFDKWVNLLRANYRASVDYNLGEQYWTDFFRNNDDIAFQVAALRAAQSEFANNALDPNGPNEGFAAVMNIIKILMDSGAFDAIDKVMPSPTALLPLLK